MVGPGPGRAVGSLGRRSGGSHADHGQSGGILTMSACYKRVSAVLHWLRATGTGSFRTRDAVTATTSSLRSFSVRLSLGGIFTMSACYKRISAVFHWLRATGPASSYPSLVQPWHGPRTVGQHCHDGRVLQARLCSRSLAMCHRIATGMGTVVATG